MVSISYAPKGTQLVSYQSVRRRRCGVDDEDHEGLGNRRWHHLRRVGRRSLAVQLRERGGRVLRRGFEIPPGTRVLVVDDVVTTGGSLVETRACIAEAGGVVIGIGVLADRTAGRTVTDVPFFACLTLDFPSFPPEACPLCAAGIPLASPRGSGKKVPA